MHTTEAWKIDLTRSRAWRKNATTVSIWACLWECALAEPFSSATFGCLPLIAALFSMIMAFILFSVIQISQITRALFSMKYAGQTERVPYYTLGSWWLFCYNWCFPAIFKYMMFPNQNDDTLRFMVTFYFDDCLLFCLCSLQIQGIPNCKTMQS